MEKYFNEVEHVFYEWNDDDEAFFESDCITHIELDEDLMEITDIEEIDYSDSSKIMICEADSVSACYEIPELKDGEKLSVTMFKIQMPNKEILSIPCLTDERAEFISSGSCGNNYIVYENDGVRDATDDEIDNAE